MRNTIFVNGSIIALITLIIFAWFISSKVVTPVVNLAKTAKNMKDGDLSIRLDESLVKDEFRAVYATINDFAEVQQRHTIDLKQEVLKQTNHLSYIIDHLIYGLIIITEKGIITSFNPAAEKIFGYLAQEAIGKNVKMLMPEPYKHKHDGFLQGYRDRDQSDITGKIRVLDGRHKGGTIFPLELTINVMISDGTRQIIGTVRDITQRVVAQQALEDKSQDLELHSHYDKSYGKIMTLFSSTHEQEMALSDLLSILADGHAFPISAIYLFNEWSGTLKLTASHGAQKTLEKEFGRGDGLIGQALIDNKAVILKDFDKNGLRIDAGVISFVPSSVVVIPISYQAKVMGVLVLAANTMLGYMELPFLERITTQIGVFIHNLRQYHDLIELTEQSRQNAEEIRQQNMELEQANKMKSEFLANMSHELRSPLNAIIGFSALLKDGVLGELEADQAEYIGDIFNSGQHLLSLINDILDLSKIEAGKMELHLEATDIPKMLNNSLSIIKEQVLERHIKLEMNIDQGVESCWLDARKSKQIIFNLLSNAVKFTPEGGAIHIHAQKIKKKDLQGITNERFIPSTQVLASTKHFLEISISDTGIGISAENQQKLFQPFVQTDATLSRKFEGTGLGLVMIKGMVELHGGKVGLQSDEGEGSTFTVWLPYRTKQATSTISATSDNPTEAKEKADGLPATPTQQEAGKGEKRTVPSPAKGVTTVLAIEDNIVESNLLKHCLESVEYAVTQVINSVDALDAMRRDKPDLITLNMKMADMDSFEFLHQKNSIPEYMNIPMLLFSTDHGSHCQSLGINAIVQKPITMQLFLSLVDSLDTQKVNDGRPSVMVVDDDPKAVKIISAYFKATNFHVTKLYNGAQALTAIRQNIPNLFVIDLMMPDMDGFELIHHLKKNKKTHNTPIIVLTAKILTEGEQKQLLQQMCDIEDAALTKNLQP